MNELHKQCRKMRFEILSMTKMMIIMTTRCMKGAVFVQYVLCKISQLITPLMGKMMRPYNDKSVHMLLVSIK